MVFFSEYVKYGFVFAVLIFTGVNGLEDGDCITLNGAEYFHFSPGGYDPHHVISELECRASCGSYFLPYSGILKQRLCFCAKDKRVEDAPAVRTEECGISKDLLVFYRSYIIVAITGLGIKPSQEVAPVASDVIFEIFHDTGENIEFIVDFGDGSSAVVTDIQEVLAHKFYVPGKYKIGVSAKPMGAPESYRVLSSADLTIVDFIEDKSVEFSCPAVVKPNVDVICKLNITTGGFMSLDVDFGDEVGKTLMGLPDTSIQAIGPLIPQHQTDEMAPKESGYMLIIPQQTPVNTRGRLSAVQLWSLESGAMAVLVLRRRCDGEACPLIRDIRSCTKEEGFCPQITSCTSNKLAKCPSHNLAKVPEFEIVHIVQIMVEVGHHYLTLNTQPEVFPGDIVAFISAMAKIAYRKPHLKERTDLGALSFDMQQSIVPQDILSDTQKNSLFPSCCE